jgi:cold shock CspA family protein
MPEHDVDRIPCIDCRPLECGQGQVFFHVSAVQDVGSRPDLRSVLSVGDAVEFELQASAHETGKVQAMRVEKLPEGTLSRETIDSARRRGTVRCFFGGDMYVVPEAQDSVMEGLNEPLGKLKFSLRNNVKAGSHVPQPGDVVEFSVSVDQIRHTLRATDIEVIATPPTQADLSGSHLVRILPCRRHQLCAARGPCCEGRVQTEVRTVTAA